MKSRDQEEIVGIILSNVASVLWLASALCLRWVGPPSLDLSGCVWGRSEGGRKIARVWRRTHPWVRCTSGIRASSGIRHSRSQGRKRGNVFKKRKTGRGKKAVLRGWISTGRVHRICSHLHVVLLLVQLGPIFHHSNQCWKSRLWSY